MPTPIARFVAKWSASGAAERANKDLFLAELCDVLDVPRPNPATGDPERDGYVFERGVRFAAEGSTSPQGFIDLYKEGCFILEAKQGSSAGSKKLGTAKRGTPGWTVAMGDAYGQALGYAKTFERAPPFLMVCDIGFCFDLYAAFDGSWSYRHFPSPQLARIHLTDLEKDPKHLSTLRKVFLDPQSLDPARHAAKVTREVARHLAELAKKLETAKHPPELIATFLMRCLFTMFAEDVGLLPERILTSAIEEHWLPSPRSFPRGIESLWQTMNEGGQMFPLGKILRFNGGLFASPTALPLDRDALKILLEAAKCNWSDVEPSIFGTLLERALDPKERHRLGAHYTPRAYVERLVRPTLEEPLRAEWEVIQAEVRRLIEGAGPEPQKVVLTEAEYLAKGRGAKARQAEAKEYEKAVKVRNAKLDEARKVLHDFHERLTKIKILDPACGSGNFLYVALDVMKRLEGEVLAALLGLGVKQELLAADALRVMPGQFLGIEVKRWAKEIAELVLWIGYLQWHFRTYGMGAAVPEPVLRDFKNIECRDAVLAWDRVDLKRDERGKPVGRWDGVTMKKSPVTGEDVPDEHAQVPVWVYVNPRKAEWPRADFIVGNPPFLGTKRMRAAMGDGYVEALRSAYNQDVEENADLVMYWWHNAATLVEDGNVRGFGFITTNSITQNFNRRVLRRHLDKGVRIGWAIADHPWTDSVTDAAVRIAMTSATGANGLPGTLLSVTSEVNADENQGALLEFGVSSGLIREDLRVGADVASAGPLKSNTGFSGFGVALHGRGFVLEPAEAAALRKDDTDGTIRAYVGGRDLLYRTRERYVIDFSGMSVEQARKANISAFQHVTDHVLPERRENRRASIRKLWWRFGWERPLVRRALTGLPRYVVTTETSKHRIFQFIDSTVLADHAIIVIAISDGMHMGILSSRIHALWSVAAGGRLGVGNDPRYNKIRCFDPFPFPVCSGAQAAKIRALGETLDVHRKNRQAAHPDLTITGMYNVLTKLRSGEALTDKEKLIHQQGLVSVLKQIHDDLDAAVFDAYGWPPDLTDEQILEKLVALNAERAEEERGGLIRWLRPDFQNPSGSRAASQQALVGTDDADDEEEGAPVAAAAKPWPKKLAEQIIAVRDLVTASTRAWSLADLTGVFSKASDEEVEGVLESLAALGLVVGYRTDAGQRWRMAGRPV